MKWTDEEKEEYYQRNKEFYDELNAEFFKKRNESMSANSEQFVPHSMELKDEEEKREKEGEEGKASSIENSWVIEFICFVFIEVFSPNHAFLDGSQQLSLGTNGSGKQYFSSDDECFMVQHNYLQHAFCSLWDIYSFFNWIFFHSSICQNRASKPI